MHMNTSDFLNITLAVGVIIVAGSVAFCSYFFVQTLKAISNAANNMEEITDGLKNRMQMKMLTVIPSILLALANKIRKGR